MSSGSNSGDQKGAYKRGLTLRSFFVSIFGLMLTGIWINYSTIYTQGAAQYGENSPPIVGVLVILIVMAVSGLIFMIRKPLRLSSAELICVYAGLLVGAPLMCQGMWHRMYGLMIAIPHQADFKSYESLPIRMWPHGKNLIVNGRFLEGQKGFTLTGNGKLTWGTEKWRGADWKCPVIENTAATDKTTLSITIPSKDSSGTKIIVPGENFLLSLLVKSRGMEGAASYAVRMKVDDLPASTVLVNTGETTPTYMLPSGFQRVGVSPLRVPSELNNKLTLMFILNGQGKITLQDIQFFNIEAVEGSLAGRRLVKEKNVSSLSEHERDFTIVKPDNMFSIAGLNYLIHGYIPLKQWIDPMITWSWLMGLLFLGYFGFNVLMRKQWVDSERFTFPMNILPRLLFAEAEETEDDGQPKSMVEKIKSGVRPIFKSRMFWVGFAVTMPLVILKGVSYYYPNVPAPNWGDMWGNPVLNSYVTNPLLKAYLQNAYINIIFSLLAITLLMETDILFSIWASFFIYQLFYLFGKAMNFNRFAGYPWDWSQSIGSFIGFALVAIIVARRHLWMILKHVVGKVNLNDSDEVVTYKTAFLMILVAIGGLVLWGLWTQTGWLAALLFFGYMLICGFTASKIRAEAGMAYDMWTPYYPMLLVSALGGFAVFGGPGVIVATIASGFMGPTSFILFAPVQVEMMELGRHFRVKPRDIGWALTIGIAGALFLGGFTYMAMSYGAGGNNVPGQFFYDQNWYFDKFREGELSMDRSLANNNLSAPENAPMNVAHNVDAKGLTIGIVVTGILTVLRSVFTWFPLHPLGYVIAATWFGRTMWLTCLVAWIIRLIVLKVGGAHSIRKGLVPFSVGMFVACITSTLIFDLIGIYLRTQGITRIYVGMP
jgi:hypothetical protein